MVYLQGIALFGSPSHKVGIRTTSCHVTQVGKFLNRHWVTHVDGGSSKVMFTDNRLGASGKGIGQGDHYIVWVEILESSMAVCHETINGRLSADGVVEGFVLKVSGKFKAGGVQSIGQRDGDLETFVIRDNKSTALDEALVVSVATNDATDFRNAVASQSVHGKISIGELGEIDFKIAVTHIRSIAIPVESGSRLGENCRENGEKGKLHDWF